MRPATHAPPARRAWTIHVHNSPGATVLCGQCGPLPLQEEAAGLRRSVLAHLAQHAHTEPLPRHLRTCRCGERGCSWHPRRRGCEGPVLLTLTRLAGGQQWRLADTCHACTAATEHAATVPEPDKTTAGTQATRPDSTLLLPQNGWTPTGHGWPGDGWRADLFEEHTWWDGEAAEHEPSG